jgi:hypothetical protein
VWHFLLFLYNFFFHFFAFSLFSAPVHFLLQVLFFFCYNIFHFFAFIITILINNPPYYLPFLYYFFFLLHRHIFNLSFIMDDGFYYCEITIHVCPDYLPCFFKKKRKKMCHYVINIRNSSHLS